MKSEPLYYIVPVFGCTDPEPLAGPFKLYRNMLRRARKIHANQKEEDAIFWLVIRNGRPMIGSFTGEELESDE